MSDTDRSYSTLGELARPDGHAAVVRDLTEQMTDVAFGELADAWASVASALKPATPLDYSSPYVALAVAAYGRFDLSTLSEIDAQTEALCGLRLWDADLVAIERSTTPYVGDQDRTHISTNSLFGKQWCERTVNTNFYPLDADRLIIACPDRLPGRLLLLDLAASRVAWHLDLPASNAGTGITISELMGLAFYVREDVTPASGLTPEHSTFHLIAVDLEDGSEAFSRELVPPADYDDTDPPSIGILAPDDRDVVLISEGWAAHHWLSALGPTGELLWEGNRARADDSGAGLVELADGSLLDPLSGRPPTIAGMSTVMATVEDGPIWLEECSSVVALGYTNSSVAIGTSDGATLTMQPVTPDQIDIKGVVSGGVLYRDLDSRDLGLIGPSGHVLWTIPAEVIDGFRIIAGVLIVTNTAGEHVVVDQATGTELRKLSPVEAEMLDGDFGITGRTWVDGGVLKGKDDDNFTEGWIKFIPFEHSCTTEQAADTAPPASTAEPPAPAPGATAVPGAATSADAAAPSESDTTVVVSDVLATLALTPADGSDRFVCGGVDLSEPDVLATHDWSLSASVFPSVSDANGFLDRLLDVLRSATTTAITCTDDDTTTFSGPTNVVETGDGIFELTYTITVSAAAHLFHEYRSVCHNVVLTGSHELVVSARSQLGCA